MLDSIEVIEIAEGESEPSSENHLYTVEEIHSSNIDRFGEGMENSKLSLKSIYLNQLFRPPIAS